MIIIKLEGGLGNQMFQYAFGKMLSEIYRLPLKLDVTALSEYRKYELDIFKIHVEIATDSDLLFFDRRNISFVNKLFFRIRNGFSKSVFLAENEGQRNITLPASLPSHTLVRGHWQSETYFKVIEEIIRTDFTFPVLTGEPNITFLHLIKNSNSVAVHIRRGDYLLPQNNQVHGLLPLSFYREAIQYLQAKTDNPEFYVFSDDVAWVKENLAINGKLYFVTGNEKKHAYIDMQLMAMCKHNIIANSSFSWWGAWLNDHNGKIVVAPRQWFADPVKNVIHNNIVPSQWIRL